MLDNKDDIIKRASELAGYDRVPPSIEDLLTDEYWLGPIIHKIFPFWKEQLRLLYNTPISSPYQFVAMKSGAGCGKSMMVMICTLINYIRLCLLKDPYEFLGISSTTSLAIAFSNTSKDRAEKILIKEFERILEQSPFVQEQKKLNGGKLPYVELVSGSKKSDFISYTIITAVLSEINNYPHKEGDAIALELLDEMISRFENRIGNTSVGSFSHIFLDSSEGTESSPMFRFLSEDRYKPYKNKILLIRAPIWVARGHETDRYWNLTPKGFFCYKGDSNISPFIADTKEEILKRDKVDIDRIIEVPSELKPYFISSITVALKDMAGESISQYGLFFENRELVNEALYLDKYYPDYISDISMSDDRRYVDDIRQDLLTIPPHRKVHVRLDVGTSKDFTGLCVAYLDYIGEDEKGRKKPFYKAPIVMGISRPVNEQTSLTKLLNLILDINEIREVAFVSTDQYQSLHIHQELKMNGIESDFISVDKDDKQYNLFKSLIYEKSLLLPKNDLLKTELVELERVGKKIDHPKSGSKDCSDALVGAIWKLHQDGLEAADLSTTSKIDNYRSVIKANNEAMKIRRLRISSRFAM